MPCPGVQKPDEIQRTVHGSYRPTYPSNARRLAPGPSRFDAPSYCYSPSNFNASIGAQLLPRRVSTSRCPSRTKFHERPSSRTSSYNTRTVSPGTIVDMYQHPSACISIRRNTPPTKHQGSFYYDYSEDFEAADPSSSPAVDPRSPIPTRTTDVCRAVLLDDDCRPSVVNIIGVDEQTLAPLLELPSPQQSSRCLSCPEHISTARPTPPKYEQLNVQLEGSNLPETKPARMSEACKESSDTLAGDCENVKPEDSSSPPVQDVGRKLIDLPMLVGLSEDLEKVILSPTPISPARNLKVRNSINQMDTHVGQRQIEKSLPPLPKATDTSSTGNTVESRTGKRIRIRNRLFRWARAVRLIFGRSERY